MSDTELDQRYLSIKKRSTSELFDLTLVVVRTEGFSVLLWLAVLAVPLAIVNHFCAAWVCDQYLLFDREETDWYLVYFFLIAFASSCEIPFVSSLPIIYLGKRVFSTGGKPKKRDVWLAWLEVLPQLIVFTIFLLPLVCFYECMSEIVSLERSPFFAKRKDQITTFRRLKNFHRDRFGEQLVMLFPIFLFGVLLAPGLLLLSYYLFYMCVGPIPNYRILFAALVVALTTWVIFAFLIVFHFLRYLDMRIEREGWDVELAFRAERSRVGGES